MSRRPGPSAPTRVRSASPLHRKRALRKPSASLWQLTIEVTPEAEEAVTELLSQILNQPVSSYTHLETQVTAVTCFLKSRKLWPISSRRKLSAGLQRIRDCGLLVGRGRVLLRKLRSRDWAEAWKHHFKPLCVGSALVIRPSWSRMPPRSSRRVVVLDPGLSFGTGQHPTTRFCLQALVAGRSRSHRQSFLDLGTGSGILAIAAAKLGYSPVWALDFDPSSIAVAQANARRNRVLNRIRFKQQDVTQLSLRPSRRYSLICANLITPLLLAQRWQIVAQLERPGALILAGILKREFGSVQAAYEGAGLKLMKKRVEKEWCSGSFSWSGGIFE